MHDVVIRGGEIVDGSGQARFRGDVGIRGTRIVEIGAVSETGLVEIDAEGHVVSPGFIDGHTHMDAQIFWDPRGESSCWNGVTTVVMGNCGFTLAPSRSDGRELVVRNLERAEDISGEAMALGIKWGFETFPEYLDVLDRLPKGINYAAQIGHSALRTWAMGERAFDAPANDDDLECMRAQVVAAMQAGAIGFTTSRSAHHETSDDRPVASRLATWSEVSALAEAAGQFGGAFELAIEPSARSRDPEEKREFVDRMVKLGVASQATVMFGVVSTDHSDDSDWRGLLGLLDAAAEAGARMFGQSHCRGVTIYNSFATQLPFDKLPLWQALRALPLAEQEAALRDPHARAQLVKAAGEAGYGRAIGTEARPPEYDRIEVLRSPLPPNPTVADVASQRGVHPVEAMIELALETDMKQFFVQHVGNPDSSVLHEIMQHPKTIMTFSDAGAHVSQIVDGALQTYFLAQWVRESQAYTLEQAVQMITAVPADAWRFHDRGRLQQGCIADLNVFDPATISPVMPRVLRDLPGGAARLEQRSAGIKATLVGGRPTIVDGEPTGEQPGRLVRGGV
jgi:N-acyl-D-amino-acid deacylase